MNNRPKLVILSLLISLTFLKIGLASAANETTDLYEYQGKDFCLACHADQGRDWEESAHATAYSNTDFQSKWNELGSPDDCLSCHTTGYNPDEGSYLYEDVTCEECHGPGLTMEINKSVELCADCHSGPYPTVQEWQASGPSHGNADCFTCHDQHSTELVYETSVETCGQCHDSHVELLETSAHADNVECSDCHLKTEPANFAENIPGDTGHSFSAMEDLDCSDCHDKELRKHDILGSGGYACLSCHGELHGLQLKLVNSTTFPLDKPVALCAQCHNERYTDWELGTHGSVSDPKASCTECHDPHDPIIAGFATLPSIPVREPAESLSPIILGGFTGALILLSAMVVYFKRGGS